MSKPEQPKGPGLTRKQLREIRMTGATPVVTPEAAEEAAAAAAAAEPASADEPVAAPAAPPIPTTPAATAAQAPAGSPPVSPPPVVPADVPSTPAAESAPAAPQAPTAHLPRAAAPAVAAPAPTPDAQVDLGVSPLTRRQAREQERIRTASVPVITPEVAAAHTGSPWAPAPDPAAPADSAVAAPEIEEEAPEAESTEDAPAEDVIELVAVEDVPGREAVVEEAPVELIGEDPDIEVPLGDADSADEATVEELFAAEVAPDQADEDDTAAALPSEQAEPAAAPPFATPEPVSAGAAAAEPAAVPDTSSSDEQDAQDEQEDRPVLRPEFGSALLAGADPAAALPPSFDELIARGSASTGSVVTPNALILTQTPNGAPLTSPVAATGEVLITGTFSLPEGLGSRGHAAGAADGKDIDSVLIDGELPAASSPTPIAASAAISTVKGTGEIIRPPAPEKGNKLMLTLAITAGALAVALVGVLILAFVTGVF